MEIELNKIEVSLTQYEAASLIESAYDSLYRKVRWSISPSHEKWHELDFRIVKSSIDALATAYMQLYMAFRQSVGQGDAISPDFEDAFIIGQEVWDVIDSIRAAEDWDEVERHLHAESLCRACRELNRVPKT